MGRGKSKIADILQMGISERAQVEREYLSKAKGYLNSLAKANTASWQQHGRPLAGIPYGNPSWSATEPAKYMMLYDYAKSRPPIEGGLLRAAAGRNRENAENAGGLTKMMGQGQVPMKDIASEIQSNPSLTQFLQQDTRSAIAPYMKKYFDPYWGGG